MIRTALVAVLLLATPPVQATPAPKDADAVVEDVRDEPTEQASEPVEVVESADLALTVRGQGGKVTPGGTHTATILVHNDGPTDAHEVVVTDALPELLTFEAANDAACGADGASPQTVTCALGTIPAGEDVELDVTSIVDPAVLGPVVTNATVTSTTPDPRPKNDSGTSLAPTRPLADVGVVTKARGDRAVPGKQLTWEVTGHNDGPSVAQDVVMTATLPDRTTLVDTVATTGDVLCSEAKGVVTCNVGALAPDGAFAIDVVAQVPPGLTRVALEYGVQVTTSTEDPNPGNDVAAARTPVTTPPPAKEPDVPPPAGDGEPADPPKGGDEPGGQEQGEPQPKQDPESKPQPEPKPDPEPEPQPEPQPEPKPDPEPQAPADGVGTADVDTADVSIVKSNPGEANAGDTFTSTLSIANAGPGPVVDVVVTDQLPAQVSVVDSGRRCSHRDGVLTCTIDTLEVGATLDLDVEFAVVETLEAAVDMTDTATIAARTEDPDTSNNASSTSMTLRPLPGTLVGAVWADGDGDGIRGEDELGLAGVEVVMSNTADDQQPDRTMRIVTDVLGAFAQELPPGDWLGEVDPDTVPFGFQPVASAAGQVTVSTGQVAEVAFAQTAGTVTGRMWSDLDGDGTKDDNEGDISGIEVILVCPGPDGMLGNADDLVATDVTSSPYEFTGVPVGQECFVEVDLTTVPSMYTPTSDPDGTVDGFTNVTVTEPAGRVDDVSWGFAGGSPADDGGGTGDSDSGNDADPDDLGPDSDLSDDVAESSDTGTLPHTGGAFAVPLALAQMLLVSGAVLLRIGRKERAAFVEVDDDATPPDVDTTSPDAATTGRRSGRVALLSALVLLLGGALLARRRQLRNRA